MRERVRSQSFMTAQLPSPYVVAQELHAPLVLIRQLIVELQHTPNTAQTLERLQLSAERSLRLVEQLTHIHRLEGALFDSEPLQARTICQTVAHELLPVARQSRQRIVTRVSRRGHMVVGDRSLLVALLIHLCDSALAHTPAGERVILSTRYRDGMVVFSVRDCGSSVDPSLDKYAHDGRFSVWVAHQFATAMNGYVTMTKHRAAGTTISVALPQSNQLALL